MKYRKGFTLAELVLSIFIFSFIATSMATIFSTANRHMFQNYRRNIIKTNVLLSMRSIQSRLSVATRVDLPLPNTAGQFLAFAINVDQGLPPSYQGCYPITTAAPASWHYYCISGTSLYYHTGAIGNSGNPCGGPAPAVWNPGTGYNVPSCAAGTLLMESVVPTLPGGNLFSRRPSDGINAADAVRVALRSVWSASGRGFGANQRDVDSSLDSVVRFNSSKRY